MDTAIPAWALPVRRCAASRRGVRHGAVHGELRRPRRWRGGCGASVRAHAGCGEGCSATRRGSSEGASCGPAHASAALGDFRLTLCAIVHSRCMCACAAQLNFHVHRLRRLLPLNRGACARPGQCAALGVGVGRGMRSAVARPCGRRSAGCTTATCPPLGPSKRCRPQSASARHRARHAEAHRLDARNCVGGSMAHLRRIPVCVGRLPHLLLACSPCLPARLQHFHRGAARKRCGQCAHDP